MPRPQRIRMMRPPQSTTNAPMLIREEQHADINAIREVHRAAFGRDAEGKFVDRLRDEGLIICSVVAAIENDIVGNVVFSRLNIRTRTQVLDAVALAPVAVTPPHQRCGIGANIIAYGLQLCRERDYVAAFVLGDPHYYTRFGFSHDSARGIRSPYSGCGPAWMAVPLADSVHLRSGAVAEYPPAFQIVD